tara:strand:- start:6 stop:395 length:390 start_codon:yes stop_codon:yes gene_type:complete
LELVQVVVVRLIVEVAWVVNQILVSFMLMAVVVVVLLDYLETQMQEELVLRLRLPLVVDKAHFTDFKVLLLMDLLQVVFKVVMVEYRGDQVQMMMLEEVDRDTIEVKIIHFLDFLDQQKQLIEIRNRMR